MSLVQNLKPPVSCENSRLSLKSNWSVEVYLQNLFLGFLLWNTCMPYIRTFSVTCFVMFYCPIIYLFLSICTHKFLDFPCSVNPIFRFFRLRTICDPVILPSTSKSHIWILIFTFGMFIFRVV